MRLNNIQQLRAIAAMLVVLAHVIQSANQRFSGSEVFLIDGTIGVDIFFVISGFIMVGVTHESFGTPNAAASFLARRAARIVPIYWLYTILIAGLFSLVGKVPPLNELVQSLAFIPYDNEGKLRPVLGVGWTLDYEVLFYTIFSCSLLLSKARGILFIFIAIIALVAIGILNPPGALYWWTRPILIEFLLGICVGLAFHRSEKKGHFGYAMPIILAIVIVWNTVNYFSAGGGAVGWRLADWITAAIVVSLAAFSFQADAKTGISRALVKVGDWSYSLYLVHIVILLVAAKASDIIFGERISIYVALLYVLSNISLSLFASYLSYRFLERPAERWLRAKLDRPRYLNARE